MKNILGIVVLASASMAFAGDADLKSAVHSVALIETMMQKYRIPGGRSTAEKPEVQLMLNEARKNCQPCLFLEFIKRTTAKNTLIKIPNPIMTQQDGATIGMDEYYTKNCPADVYQKIPDDVLLGLVTSDSNKVQ